MIAGMPYSNKSEEEILDTPEKDEVEILAEEHGKFLAKWTYMVAIEVFKHGYKHGQEDLLEEQKDETTS